MRLSLFDKDSFAVFLASFFVACFDVVADGFGVLVFPGVLFCFPSGFLLYKVEKRLNRALRKQSTC